MALISASICLTDIQKEIIQTGRNGKKYINISIVEKKEKDQYGNTHAVSINQTKEERQAGKPKMYIGNGKLIEFNNAPQEADDLPF